MKYTIGWELDGKKVPTLWEKYEYQFLRFSPYNGFFFSFCQSMENWWGNPCIYHVMKYTIGWELDGKKVPTLWEKYEYQILRFSPYNGFCCIFLIHGKLIGKPMHFPYDEVYHRVGIWWEKSTHAIGKVWVPISQVFPIWWVLLHFPMLWELMWKHMHFPYDEIR